MTAFFDKIDRLFTIKGLACTLLAIVYLFLFFAGFPVVANAADKTTTAPVDDKPIVVSMGDSFSSGEGIEPFYDQDKSNAKKVESHDWLAHRSQKSWPGMLEIPGLDEKTEEYKTTGNWYFVAASGAETKHISYEQDKDYSRGAVNQYSGTAYLPPQIDVFKSIPAGTVDYVTITIGGNDAGFTKIIEEAVLGSTYLNTSKLEDKLSKTWQKFYKKDGIRDDIYNTYKKIEKAAGTNAQIIVAGYPQLLDPEGAGWFSSLDEATQINTAVSNFNIEIEKIVEQCQSEGMKICFVSVEDAFSGHEAYSDDPYINSVYFGTKDEDLKNIDKCSSYSMHPTYDGAIEYANCVNKKIEQLAEEEAARKEQEALNPSKKDREIVLVLDASGSMSGTPMDETKKASHEFVDTVLGAEANVGIVSYDTVATVSSPITDSKEYLDNAIDGIYPGGSTNIEEGLKMAEDMLSVNDANKKIIVLMSDGMPNHGKQGQELINYAESLKDKGYYIYTLGFFSDVSSKSECQSLMNGIASEGCHFEVTDADSLVFFFGDIADQISGEKYIYIRIACPVDVTVSYDGEELSSEDTDTYARTSFGSITFEENKHSNSHGRDNRIKILRLKEGVDYDVEIEGNGKGEMDYSIGFVDEDGEYSDVREFFDVEITKKTKIDTVATVSDATYMYVDQDGDGKYDITYRAYEDSAAEEVDYSYIIDICVAAIVIFVALIIVLCLRRYFKIRKYIVA